MENRKLPLFEAFAVHREIISRLIDQLKDVHFNGDQNFFDHYLPDTVKVIFGEDSLLFRRKVLIKLYAAADALDRILDGIVSYNINESWERRWSPSPINITSDIIDPLKHIPAIAKDLKLLFDHHPAIRIYANEMKTFISAIPQKASATLTDSINFFDNISNFELLSSVGIAAMVAALTYEASQFLSMDSDDPIKDDQVKIDKSDNLESKTRDSYYNTNSTVFQRAEKIPASANQNLFSEDDPYSHGCGFGFV